MKRLLRSIRAALNGFRHVLVFELNFRIMMIVAFLVVALMIYIPTTSTEKEILLVMIFAVLILELINSVIERIMDFLHIGHHEKVREIKDLMAAVSLVAVIASVVIGVLVFYPHIVARFF